jgi:hypothetical protein
MFILALSLLADDSFAGAKASAFAKESKKGTNYWNAGSAIDGKMETAWMVPGESPNRGEWIELDVPKGEVDKIGIVAGWDKDEESFKDYPRIAKVRVDIFSVSTGDDPTQVGTATVDVVDQRGWQIIDIPDTKVGSEFFGGKVRITVLEVAEGEDFPNLGVSEVCVFLKEFDAQPKIAAATSGDITMLSDANPKTLWTGAAGAEITVTPGGFAVSSVGFSGDKAHGRAKTVKLTVGNVSATATLADKPDLQWVGVPASGGYVGSSIDDVVITVVDVYPSAANDLVIADLKFKASYFESL